MTGNVRQNGQAIVGRPAEQVSKDLGVSQSLLYRWESEWLEQIKNTFLLGNGNRIMTHHPTTIG